MSRASQDHYRRLNSAEGKALRDFFNAALADADRLPGKRQLKAMAEELAETVPGLDPVKAAERFTAYAHQAQRVDGHAGHRFELRGQVDQLAGALVGKLEDADRLVPVEESTPEEIGAAADAAGAPVNSYWDKVQGEMNAALTAKEQAMVESRRAATLARGDS